MNDKILEYQNYAVYYPEDALFDLNDINHVLFGMSIILEEIIKHHGTQEGQHFEEFTIQIAETFNDYMQNDTKVGVEYYFFDDSCDNLVFRLSSENDEEN